MKQAREATARKLIDRLSPEPRWGALRGFVATTYELQPEFLETDFLPALLGLGAWDDHSWSTRIALERKLAELEAATILMEAHRYRGRPRSLRVELVTVAGPRGPKQHAKATLLLYQHAVRFIVASANLTEPGYRRNREVVAVLGSELPPCAEVSALNAALEGFAAHLDPWLTENARGLLQAAREALGGAPSRPASKVEMAWSGWSGGAAPLADGFLARWPAGEPADRLTVISPFWSDDGGAGLRRFVDLCRRRGLAIREVRLLTEAAPGAAKSYAPVLPPSFDTTDWRALGLRVSAQAVSPLVLPEEVGGMQDFAGTRRLHAKVALLEGPRAALAYLGSANFTARGWAIGGAHALGNVEAGVILRLQPGEATLQHLLPPLAGEPLWLDGAAGPRLISPEPIAEDPPWPAFLREVKLVPSPADLAALQLHLVLIEGAAHVAWSVALPGSDDARPLAQASSSSGETVHVSLDESALERVLIEQELLVRWAAYPQGRLVPVNVDAAARFQLPIAPGSGLPGEAELLAYYQGRISWEALFPEPTDSAHSAAGAEVNAPVVDKSRIQTYQVREFVEALAGIRQDLRLCAVSAPAIRLALHGPVSPVALARTVIAACDTRRRTPMAAAFQLVEIMACLREAQANEVPKSLLTAWKRGLGDALAEVGTLLRNLEPRHPAELRGRGFRAYRNQILPGLT